MQKNLHQQVLENGLHVIVAPKKDPIVLRCKTWPPVAAVDCCFFHKFRVIGTV